MAGETLPPVVAVLEGRISDLAAKISAAKKDVQSMDSVTGTAHVNVDKTFSFDSDLADATAEVEAFGRLSPTAHLQVDSASLSMFALGIQHSMEQAVAGGIAAGLAGKVAGGGAGGGGLLAALGWGGGALGFAAFGSVLSLMGFGLEHFVATGIGLAGSLAGAFVGAFALMAGSAAIMAVGMGSDMAVARSAIADTTSLSTALTAINTATLTYGASSAQAALATQQLKVLMRQLGNTAGVLAELQLAKAVNALNGYWDQATSGARVAFVNMVTPLLSIAYTYIPLVAASATRNFGIIQQGLVPVVAYLNGPATAIFQNLEDIFAARLPTAMSAFNQGLQVVVKTLDYLANQTGGGFMIWLNNLFTYLNTPTGFVRLEHGLSTVIGMFLDWWGLLKQIVITIYDLFKPSVGLGSGIVVALTGMLKSLDAWMTSTNGKNLLGNLFTVHKTEFLLLMQDLGQILAIGGQIYLSVVPAFVDLSNVILKLVGFLLSNPIVDMFLGWGAAILFFGNNIKKAWVDLKGMALTVANMGIGLLNLIPGVNISKLGGAGATATNTASLDANTAAITRLTAVMGGEGAIGGAGGGAAKGAGAGGLVSLLADAGLAGTAVAGLSAAALIAAPALLVLTGSQKQQNGELAKANSSLSAFNASISTASRFGNVTAVGFQGLTTGATALRNSLMNVYTEAVGLATNFANVTKGAVATAGALGLNWKALVSNNVAVQATTAYVHSLGMNSQVAAQIVATMPKSLIDFRGGVTTAYNGLKSIGPGSAAAINGLNAAVRTFVNGVVTGVSNMGVTIAQFVALGAQADAYLVHNIPHHAAGGYYPAGQLSIVGENGPELFMSGSSGNIVPNSALGGTTVHLETNVTVMGGTSPTGLAQLEAVLNQRDQQLAQRLRMGW